MPAPTTESVEATDAAAPQGGSQATLDAAKQAEAATVAKGSGTEAIDTAKAAEAATTKKIRELEKDNKEYRDKIKAAEDAALSETERIQKQAAADKERADKNEAAALEARLQVAAFKAGLVDPTDAVLLSRELIEVGDDGTPSTASLTAAFADLKVRKPHLFGPVGPTGSADGGSRTPQVADIDADAEKLRAAGRAVDAVALKVKAAEVARTRPA